MPHKSDLKLAKALVSGDEQQFNQFFGDYFPRLFRFALSRLDANEDLARDIAQTTMMNAVRHMDSYRGNAAMFTWLCQICRNEIAGYYRKLSKSVPEVTADDDSIRSVLESLEVDEAQMPDSQYESLEVSKLIQEVLDFLPVNYGNALDWKYIQGYSVSEIANRLQLSELGAQSLLARARTAFRKALIEISPQLAAANGAP